MNQDIHTRSLNELSGIDQDVSSASNGISPANEGVNPAEVTDNHVMCPPARLGVDEPVSYSLIPVPLSSEGNSVHGTPQTGSSDSGSQTADTRPFLPSSWPEQFSLDMKPGLSSLIIGLSSESDPFLLRNYQYDVHDTYRMFRLHFRKVIDDNDVPHKSFEKISQKSSLPIGSIPVQFGMTDEEIFRDDINAAEKMFSGHSTEKKDCELLDELVPVDLGSRLLKL